MSTGFVVMNVSICSQITWRFFLSLCDSCLIQGSCHTMIVGAEMKFILNGVLRSVFTYNKMVLLQRCTVMHLLTSPCWMALVTLPSTTALSTRPPSTTLAGQAFSSLMASRLAIWRAMSLDTGLTLTCLVEVSSRLFVCKLSMCISYVNSSLGRFIASKEFSLILCLVNVYYTENMFCLCMACICTVDRCVPL